MNMHILYIYAHEQCHVAKTNKRSVSERYTALAAFDTEGARCYDSIRALPL